MVITLICRMYMPSCRVLEWTGESKTRELINLEFIHGTDKMLVYVHTYEKGCFTSTTRPGVAAGSLAVTDKGVGVIWGSLVWSQNRCVKTTSSQYHVSKVSHITHLYKSL